MPKNRPLVVVALVAALFGGGCTTEDASSDPDQVAAAQADAIVLLKPTATDLNALDLREKIIKLPGVDGVVYDQGAKRLRIDFAAAASEAERAAASEAARSDPAVAQVQVDGAEQTVGEQPAAPSGAPAPTS